MLDNDYIIEGKKIAQGLKAEIKDAVGILAVKHNIKPCLFVVIVGDDPASHVYVNNKIKTCTELNIDSRVVRLPVTVAEPELTDLIKSLNQDQSVNGILVQLPLPRHIDENAVIEAIKSDKDVDGFTHVNTAKLANGNATLIPCTPMGCMKLIQAVNHDISGKRVLVIGRSNIVGKPVAMLMLNANATVTIAHSKTKNLDNECKNADIIIVAVGSPKFIKGEWVNNNSTVIDVGINRVDGKIVGDVDTINFKEREIYFTPVPGGVGPMTIACLMRNTFIATCMQNGVNYRDILVDSK